MKFIVAARYIDSAQPAGRYSPLDVLLRNSFCPSRHLCL